MSSSHTPGPWTAVADAAPENAPGANQLKAWSVTTPSIFVASTGYHNQSEENARLIAAAPDLLAACKLALAAYPGPRATHGNPAILKAAIDKAEGTPLAA